MFDTILSHISNDLIVYKKLPLRDFSYLVQQRLNKSMSTYEHELRITIESLKKASAINILKKM